MGLPSPYLMAFESRFVSDLVQPFAIPAADGALARVDGQWAAEARGFVDETRADVARDLGQIDGTNLKVELAGGQGETSSRSSMRPMQARRLGVDLLDLRDQARPLRSGVEARRSRSRFETSSLSAVSGVRSSCEATDKKSSRKTTA